MTGLPTVLTAALSDRYRIERELGAGGMATVYLAHDLKHDRDVAIKVLHQDLAAALGAERFLAEIKTTAKLQHPHILPLLDSGEAAGLLYYVMPYLKGESLRDRLNREKQLPIEDAVRIAREVADALGHAHGHEVIHRDIKPENILLQEGHALVADFGIALAVQSAGGQRMTQTGLSLGTPQYMSPEQAMGEKAIDARADIYALGAVTYEMLTGEPPFTGATVQAIVARVMSERPTPITTFRDTVPEHINAAVMKALAKLPADRWGSAADYVRAFEGAELPAGRHAVSDGQRRSRKLSRSAALAVAGAVVGGIAVWISLRGDRIGNAVPTVYTVPLPAPTGWRNETRIAISPDGRTLAFVAPGEDGVARIWLRDRAERKAIPVPGSEGALNVFYSPDGDRIAFLTDDPLVLHVASPGQPPATLATIRAGIAGGVGGAWSRDGWIYVGGAGLASIQRIRVSDRRMEAVTVLDSAGGEAWHGQPSISDNGKTVVFTIADSSLRPAEYRVAVSNVGSGEHTTLQKGVRGILTSDGLLLVATVDGTLSGVGFDARRLKLTGAPIPFGEGLPVRSLATVEIAVSSTGRLAYVTPSVTNSEPAADSARLVWAFLDGRIVDVSTARAIRPGGDFALSPDGRRIALTVQGGQGPDIWMLEVGSGGLTRLTTDGGREPLFSHDGREVMYLRAQRNSAELFARASDGSGAERLATQQRSAIHTDATWTPNGDQLVFETWRSKTGEDIMQTAIAPGSSATAILETPANEMNPRLSPDGKWLAYVSDESGRVEVHLRPFPDVAAGHWQVSRSGGKEPEWSHAGSRLFFVDFADTVWAAPIATGSKLPAGPPKPLFAAGNWRRSGSILRSTYNVAQTDDKLLMLRRASPQKQAFQEIVVVEHYKALLQRGKPGR